MEIDFTPVVSNYVLTERAFRYLSNEMEKSNRRARKNNLPEIKVENLGVDHVVVNEETQTRRTFLNVRVSGTTVRVRGWKFVAKIEQLEGGNLISGLEGSNAEEFRNCDLRCDHCNKIRRRNATFVIEKEGARKLIGRSCLKDFFNGINFQNMAENLVGWVESSVRECSEQDDKEWERGNYSGCTPHYPVHEFVAHAIYFIDRYGYEKQLQDDDGTSRGVTTKGRVMESLWGRDTSEYKCERAVITDEINAKATEVVEWVANKMEGTLPYHENLRVIARSSYIPGKQLGITVSAYQVWKKHFELIEAKKVAVPSEHVGKIGDRIEITGTIKSTRLVETMYGDSTWIKILSGTNIFSWKASGDYSELVDGAEIVLKGTIKDHSTWSPKEGLEFKETRLTRCKILK